MIFYTTKLQVNTLAAEKLYSLAGDWAGLGPDTLLFDICCGTGTIGLTLAHRVGMVMTICQIYLFSVLLYDCSFLAHLPIAHKISSLNNN